MEDIVPMTQEQLDNWFTYHATTDETAPKYAAIRAAEDACRHGLTMGIGLVDEPAHVRFGHINAACRTFALVIDEQAPDSADKTAAIRCVRLARNAANEAVIDTAGAGRLQAVALTEIQKARWQANSAIACGGR